MKPEQAIHMVFDQYRGMAVVLPALAALALQHMDVLPVEYKRQERRVLKCVHHLANKGVLSITAGRYGGVRRLADMPAQDPLLESINRRIKKLKAKRKRIFGR